MRRPLATESSANVPRPSGLLVRDNFRRCWIWLLNRLGRDGRRNHLPRLRLTLGEGHAADFFEFLERRQFADVVETELNQEIARGLVEDRLADDILTPCHGDQL